MHKAVERAYARLSQNSPNENSVGVQNISIEEEAEFISRTEFVADALQEQSAKRDVPNLYEDAIEALEQEKEAAATATKQISVQDESLKSSIGRIIVLEDENSCGVMQLSAVGEGAHIQKAANKIVNCNLGAIDEGCCYRGLCEVVDRDPFDEFILSLISLFFAEHSLALICAAHVFCCANIVSMDRLLVSCKRQEL